MTVENGPASETSGTLQAIRYSRGKLQLLDQRRLPLESVYLDIPGADEAWHAIKDMVVRGAPAIAIAAALALAVELETAEGSHVVKQREAGSAAAAVEFIAARLDHLVSSRPTAVNLADAAGKLKAVVEAARKEPSATAESVVEAYIAAAEAMLRDDVASNKAIGQFGVEAILAALKAKGGKEGGLQVLTHCNTGSLATAAYGTALGVIRSLHSQGKLAKAFCTETRPYNQGSRLTAYELVHDGIPATLIADSAAASLQAAGQVDAIVVGADRIAANGDTANKIGTYSLALSAHHHGIPFFVAAPLTSIDAELAKGGDIVIEERSPKELTHALGGAGPQVAASGIGVWNPSFDVTTADVITAIITDKGTIWKAEGSSDFDIPSFLRQHSAAADSTATLPSAPAPTNPGLPPVSSKYRSLAETSVRSYIAAAVPDLARSLGGVPAEWEEREVGDGNMNFVYILSGPDKSVVVKQAVPYIRCVGESWPMTSQRILFEATTLQAQHAIVPDFVPEVFHFDGDMAVMVMEYLAPPHIILRKGLIQGIVYPLLADHVATFLARTLFTTSLLAVSTEEFRKGVAKFCENVDMCRLTEQVIFTEPYFSASNNRWTTPQLDEDVRRLQADEEAKKAIAFLKAKFCEQSQALLHGDLHTGSIMAHPSSTKVIDPEFAFYGPMGFDVGAFVANLILSYFSQDGHATAENNRGEYKQWILKTIAETWNKFASKFVELWDASWKKPGDAYAAEVYNNEGLRAAVQREFIADLFQDSLGFAGAKIIRRLVGIAHVEDMESIVDPDVRAKCERKALEFGKLLLKNRSSFSSIEGVVAKLTSLA